MLLVYNCIYPTAHHFYVRPATGPTEVNLSSLLCDCLREACLNEHDTAAHRTSNRKPSDEAGCKSASRRRSFVSLLVASERMPEFVSRPLSFQAADLSSGPRVIVYHDALNASNGGAVLVSSAYGEFRRPTTPYLFSDLDSQRRLLDCFNTPGSHGHLLASALVGRANGEVFFGPGRGGVL
jgi:hypothetical protein